tara:strand:+ start:133 stop:582 length:450 start_codon:yes stop_codon:yes gene_type:complete
MTTSFLLAGLGLDLIGVALLAFDLIRVQRRLRTEASERMILLNDLIERNETFEKHADFVAGGGDWREHQYEEGQMVPYGGFDHTAAQSSFKDAVDLSVSVRNDLTEFVFAVREIYSQEHENAGKSLVYSYFGIGLIVAGFALQILGNLA